MFLQLSHLILTPWDSLTLAVPHCHKHIQSVGNSYKCCKSTVLARMVSGRYRCETMCRFWSSNKKGFCLAPTCHEVPGDLEHLLTSCPALEHTRHQLHSLWCRKKGHLQPLHSLILPYKPYKSDLFLIASLSQNWSTWLSCMVSQYRAWYSAWIGLGLTVLIEKN